MPKFLEAIVLVVLVQVSSAAAERVFSQLKLVRDTCGDNMLEKLLELRLYCLVNGVDYLCDEFHPSAFRVVRGGRGRRGVRGQGGGGGGGGPRVCRGLSSSDDDSDDSNSEETI